VVGEAVRSTTFDESARRCIDCGAPQDNDRDTVLSECDPVGFDERLRYVAAKGIE
jgi:hypothetical protein